MGRNPGLPHYRRVMDAVLTRMRETGARMPSERAVARRYGVSRGTAVRALNELEKAGHVLRLQGSGTYAALKPARVVCVFGYYLDSPRFAPFYRWLQQRLSEEGLRPVIKETGLKGEYLARPASVTAEAKALNAEAVIWFASSHPDGVKTATRIRRKFPVKLPLVLVNDPLGLAPHGGGHRFDFMHFDAAASLRRLLARLQERGDFNPVFVERGDIDQHLTREMRWGFLAELAGRGVANPSDHVMEWHREEPRTFRCFFERKREWKPTAFILQYSYENEFLQMCRQFRIKLGKDVLIIPHGANPTGLPLELRMPVDYRALAETCADLLLSRLARPSRANLHVGVNTPLRSKSRQP